MNWVDLVILVALGSAIASGIRKGAAVQLFSFGGFWLGFAIGSALAPFFVRLVSGPFSKALVSVAVVFGLASIIGSVGRISGTRIWGKLRMRGLGTADAAGGAAISTVATVFVVWLITTILSGLPLPQISGEVQQSRIVHAIAKTMPPAPSVFTRLRNLLDFAGFPDVFAELEPPPSKPVALPDDPEVRAAVAAARASTVKIEGFGCGGIKSGSGFIVAPGVVVTNAHVVSGIDNPSVQDNKGRHSAKPVFFDPNYDLAILRTTKLTGKPLGLLKSPVRRGQKGAALGFPGGGPFTATAAAVLQDINAVGRDIYSRSLTTRRVYEIQSEVHPGNSGGPLVRSDGTVVGVVFSASAFRPNVAYALRSVEVAQKVDASANTTTAVDTGPCS